jgi:aryl-alcohol dehydrogenase-like predicted oxidoreductase
MNTSMRSRYCLADRAVWRVGYGAMQLAGDGVFGPPRDRDEAIAVLRAAVDAGVDHIDTAQYYGPGVVNELIRDALHPYPDGLALVSKVAARCDDSGAVLPYDDPDELRAGIHENLTTLRVERLTAVNLRVMDNAAPDGRFVDQLGALEQPETRDSSAELGSATSAATTLIRALEVTEIVCVQNFFNLAARNSMSIPTSAAHGRSRSCRSVPWVSRHAARGDPEPTLSSTALPLTTMRALLGSPSRGCWPSRPTCLLIPGTRIRAHLAENLAAGSLWLGDREMALLNEEFKSIEPPTINRDND